MEAVLRTDTAETPLAKLPRPERVAILQSNYIPWKGYFDIIRSVDVFVVYDDVQYTKNDWRNRNRIKTRAGVKWLTIPVRREASERRINEVRVVDDRWRRKHWTSLSQNYARAPYFKEYEGLFAGLYLDCRETNLSRINLRFIEAVNRVLGVGTALVDSSQFPRTGLRTERLVAICKQLGAKEYLTGPAARDYLDEARFRAEDICVRWVDYRGYPEYRQLHPPFVHTVSVLDLIFAEGPNASRYLRRF